jgi:hypothetical protein
MHARTATYFETRAHLQMSPFREVADEISRIGWVVQALRTEESK